MAEVLGGVEILDAHGEAFWLIELDLTEHWPETAKRLSRLPELLAAAPEALPDYLAAAAKCDPEGLLFLDIETGGFMGNPVFLIGCLDLPKSGPRLRLWLARDLDEEIPMLGHFGQAWHGYPGLVTYNGKSFDLPFILDRMTLWRIEKPTWEIAHLDLLHAARKQFRGELPNCKLQTLERHLLGRGREDDLPSGEVPQSFYDFAATGDPHIVAPILQHNAIDLVTLAELLVRFLERL